MSFETTQLKKNSSIESTTLTNLQKEEVNSLINNKKAIIIDLINQKGSNESENKNPLFCEKQTIISIPFYKDQNSNIHLGFINVERPVLNIDINTYHLLLEKAVAENNPKILSQESIFGDNLIEIPQKMDIEVNKNIQQIGNTYSNPSLIPTKVPIFALDISKSIQSLKAQELNELSNMEFIEINKVNQMILNGEILDAMSITAIKQLELFLASQKIQEQNPKKITSFMEFLINLNPFS